MRRPLRARLEAHARSTWPLVVLASALFVACFWRVLAGNRVLIGGDILYACCFPWAASAGAHPAANVIVGDPVLQFLPWQGLVRDAFLHGRLPLWDPFALGGKPLLANDQSAAFSPFTWIALPFAPAVGLSVAMLCKLVFAGAGMWLYLGRLRLSGPARFAGAVAYATSGYMAAWLAWPHTGVAALLPWAFAAAEWYVDTGSARALAAVAGAVGLQFLAGHAETSLHLGFGLGLYSVVRTLPSRPLRLAGLAAGGAVGAAIAGVQLVPFVSELGTASIVQDRAGTHLGAGHLAFGALGSWLVPNARGNPGIDHLLGRPPNFNESTGFATVTLLLLSPPGLLRLWRRVRGPGLALALLGLVAAGIVYGPLSPVAGVLPGLSVSANGRMVMLIGFSVSALGAAGVDWVAAVPPTRVPRPLMAAAAAVFLAEVVGAVAFAVLTTRLIHRLGNLPGGYETYWTLMAAVAAAACVALSWVGRRGLGTAPAALAALVLVEGALFAVPYQPQVRPADAPPPSQAIEALRSASAGGGVVALGGVLPPESPTLYGLRDLRSYDVVTDPRARIYWSAADPRFHDQALSTVLEAPRAGWLRAAGVTAVMATPDTEVAPGLERVAQADGVVIWRVPGARPYAFAPESWTAARDPRSAAAAMDGDPMGPVVIEGAAGAGAGGGSVDVVGRLAGSIALDVNVAEDQPVVVLESYAPGWRAAVDGRAAAVHPAGVLFMAVDVPAGRHRVTLDYAPESVPLGAALSVGGLVVVALLAAWPWVRRFARRREAPA